MPIIAVYVMSYQSQELCNPDPYWLSSMTVLGRRNRQLGHSASIILENYNDVTSMA